MELTNARAESTSVAESRIREQTVAAFEDAWLRGHPPGLEAFLEPFSGSQRGRILRELVHVDLERRLSAGETVRVEEYLARYPELREGREELLALVQWEFRLRKLHETGLSFDEYRARFPDLGPELAQWLARASCAAQTVACPDPPAFLTEGEPVPGYQLLEELGHGGMGVVYKAQHLATNRLVALKVIRRDLRGHPGARKRFGREIQAATRLDHPNIVRVYDGAQAGDTCYLAMEYLEGQTLQVLVERHGRRAVWEACELVRQAALGLQHAHECGLVHRDIKPSNLMLVPGALGVSTSPGTIKLLDLGLVRIDGSELDPRSSTLTQPGVLMGTIDFIAPEQAINPHLADHRADLYSLGCTFYYLLLGRVPFPVGSQIEKLDKHRWTTPRAVDRLRNEVPRGVAAVVDRLLAKEPPERHQTAAELAEALAPFCDPDACLAARAAQAPRATPPASQVVAKPAPREPVHPVGLVHRLMGHRDTVCGVAVTADGSHVVSASRDSSVRVWNVGARTARPLHGHAGEVRCVAVSSDSRRALTGGSDRIVRVWELATGRVLATLCGHSDAVKSVAFSDDGTRALSAGNDRRVVLWDLQAGRKVRSLKGHTGDINCVAFAPGTDVAVSGGWDKTLRVWDLVSGKELWCLGGPFSPFQWSVFMGIVFHPDGRLLVGSSDHTLCLIDLSTGSVAQRFEGHTNWASSVAVSPDGRHALSGSWDGTVRLWDIVRGRAVSCFEGHTDQVQSVVFAPDGVHAFSGGSDRTVIRWRVLS
jgi:WD40 repeat protein